MGTGKACLAKADPRKLRTSHQIKELSMHITIFSNMIDDKDDDD